MCKEKIEFRYYNIQSGQYVLPLLGQNWTREYGVDDQGVMHFHNYMELGYCYKGEGKLTIENQAWSYHDGMISVIPENIVHITESTPGHQCHWEFLFVDVKEFVAKEMQDCFVFPEEIMEKINGRALVCDGEGLPVMAGLIRRIIEESRIKPKYYKESIKGYLRVLIIELIRLNAVQSATNESAHMQNHIKKALQYITDHCTENIRIGDVAKACGLSESHFRRSFEEIMNSKPMDFINMVRIKKACKLICEKDLSMEEIGIRVGFASKSTFNRNFKKLTGFSPYQWKDKVGNKEDSYEKFNVSVRKGWE